MAWSILVNGTDLTTVSTYVKDERGVLDIPGRQVTSIPIYGRASALLVGTGVGLPRTLEINALLAPSPATAAARRTAEDSLKNLLANSLIRIVWNDGYNTARMIEGRLDGAVVIRASNHPIAPEGAEVSFRVICSDAYWRDQEPTSRVLGATRATLPLGTAPSSPVIRLIGAATTPVLTYRDAGGASTRTLSMGTLNANEWYDIDTRQGTLTKYVSGTASESLGAISAGDFPWALDPQDGDWTTSQWPTLEVSSGTGIAYWWKAFQ